MDGRTASVRVPEELANAFDNICEKLGIDKSDFIRACMKQLVEGGEAFLKSMGFEKREVWKQK